MKRLANRFLGLESLGQLPSLSELRRLVAVMATRYSLVLSFPLLFIAVYRGASQGWNWYVSVQTVAYTALVLGLLFHRRLKWLNLSDLLVYTIMIVGASGVAAWGPAPSRFVLLLSSCVFSAILHGMRGSIKTVLVSTILICIAAMLNKHFGELPGGDSIANHDFSQWVVTIVSYVFYAFVGTLMVSWVSGMLQKTIVTLKLRDEDLRRSNDLLQQQAVTLEEQAVELEEHADALREERDRAQCSARAKEQFLNVVSHELRTPLNPILGFAELIEEEPTLSDEAREELLLMRKSAKQLLKMISRVVDYSEIDRGELTLNKSTVTIGELKEEIGKFFDGESVKNRIQFEVRCKCEERQPVVLEKRLVLHVIEELGSNAIKFTELGKVTIELDLEVDFGGLGQLSVEVKDTGFGIEPERLTEIFDPFVLVDQNLTRERRGIGLGLAISNRIAEVLGAKISAKSEVGEGSEFNFKVPVEVKQLAESENQKNRTSMVFENPVRVLVAEDDFVNQRVVSKMLKRMGAECVCVENGKLALETLGQENYDIVLMDVSMPIMDGIESTQRIRDSRGMESLPIIALTAHSYAQSEEACYKAGMNAFLTKPVQKDLLYQTISRFSKN